MSGEPPRVFRDTARLAVALLMFRDMVMCPRKGDFSVLFDEENCFCGSPFAFYIQVNSTHRPAPETKKRWGPALWLWKGLVAPAGAKLRKQQLKIR